MRARCERLSLTPLNLTVTRPAIPKGNILLIEGIHDLFVPKEDCRGSSGKCGDSPTSGGCRMAILA